jgi:benzoate 4-monooxygenase
MFALFILALLRYVLHPDPLRDIPGPWLARHTAILLTYYTRTGKRYLYAHALHKVRIP